MSAQECWYRESSSRHRKKKQWCALGATSALGPWFSYSRVKPFGKIDYVIMASQERGDALGVVPDEGAGHPDALVHARLVLNA